MPVVTGLTRSPYAPNVSPDPPTALVIARLPDVAADPYRSHESEVHMHMPPIPVGTIAGMAGLGLTTGVLAIGAHLHPDPRPDLPLLRRLALIGVAFAAAGATFWSAVDLAAPTSGPAAAAPTVLLASSGLLALVVLRTFRWVARDPVQSVAATLLATMAVATAVRLGAAGPLTALLLGVALLAAGAWVGGGVTLAVLLRQRDVEVRDNAALLLRRRLALSAGLVALMLVVPPTVAAVGAGIVDANVALLVPAVGTWAALASLVLAWSQSGLGRLARPAREMVAGAMGLLVHHRPEAMVLSGTLTLVAVLALAG